MASDQTPLRIIPLGGLDGIGKNMTVFEYGQDMVLVDAGLMFPDEDQLGIDSILPDYSYVLQNEHKLKGILITHGHEDHIGSLPYLLLDLSVRVPIYSSKFTLGIIAAKLSEHRIQNPLLREVKNNTNITLGKLSVTFFSMTHSIPASFGISIDSPEGTVMHTGDFKLDQTPIDHVKSNFAAISRSGAAGVDLLISDSTNALRPGFTPSEANVGPALRHIIKNAPGRVFVAAFSSHIHRIQQVCDASVAVGRKVMVTGRSMISNVKIARKLGYLSIPDDDILDAYDTGEIPDENIVVLCTGSQGEPLSALSRMASGEHKTLSIYKNDTVIISSSPVPGNEKSVQAILNMLSRIGCMIYDNTNSLVHVSGHASSEELKLLLCMANPRYFMPFHGESQHLRAHAELAMSVGIPEDHIFVLDNGDSLEMKNHKVTRGSGVESSIVFVEGGVVYESNPIVLRDRQKMAQDGLVICTVVLKKQSRYIKSCDFTIRGVSAITSDVLNDSLANLVQTQVNKLSETNNSDIESLRRALRGSISTLLWNETHTRPMIIPLVVEV